MLMTTAASCSITVLRNPVFAQSAATLLHFWHASTIGGYYLSLFYSLLALPGSHLQFIPLSEQKMMSSKIQTTQQKHALQPARLNQHK